MARNRLGPCKRSCTNIGHQPLQMAFGGHRTWRPARDGRGRRIDDRNTTGAFPKAAAQGSQSCHLARSLPPVLLFGLVSIWFTRFHAQSNMAMRYGSLSYHNHQGIQGAVITPSETLQVV